MCGIIGFTGAKKAIPYLLDGLSSLEYRGYDSSGIALIDDNSIKTFKSKGRLTNLKKKLENTECIPNSYCGIGHTRWATHGEPSDANSHPHGTKYVSIVHNGIIENYEELKNFLKSKKVYKYTSKTDTEVAAFVIDYFFEVYSDPYIAMSKAIELFEGSYAIAAIFKGYPDKIFAVRKDNPLIIAISDSGNFIASDIPAILKHTRKFYHIFEGEIAEISSTSVTIFDNKKAPVERQLEIADWDIEGAEKGGHPHFMIKEILEESECIIKTLRPKIKDGLPFLGIDTLCDSKLASFKKIHILGCGTAMHAGLIGKLAIENLARIPVNVEIASEFRYNNPITSKDDLAIIISQSGETADTLAALKLAKKQGMFTLAIVNVVGSTIAREADAVLYTGAGPEIAVASTKAYTVQLSILYLFAIRIAFAVGSITEKMARALVSELYENIPDAINDVHRNSEQIRNIAEKYKNSTNIFYIGRGYDYAISLEAALKLKEISYIHCEAYPAGELKHGTISLISDGVPVIALANSDLLFPKMISNIKEVKSRGANVILICRRKDEIKIPENLADDIILIPEVSELFMPFPASTAVQMIAYHTASLLGCDVDKPRNLAKSVTVE